MQHSSRHNPCPVCGRDSDDKCRWNDSSILCYCGDSFRPRESLSLGDIIHLSDQPWKLISYYSGFAKASYLFIKINEFYDLSPLERRKKKVQIREKSKEINVEYKEKFARVRNLLHRSLAIPDLEYLNLREITEGRNLTELALVECSKLLSMLVENKAFVAAKKNHVFVLRNWQKTLKYQLASIELFENLYLMPTVKFSSFMKQESSWF